MASTVSMAAAPARIVAGLGRRMGVMANGLRWAVGVAGLPLIAVTPYLWWWAPHLLWVAVAAVVAWAVWLTLEYLRWARTLGKR